MGMDDGGKHDKNLNNESIGSVEMLNKIWTYMGGVYP